MKKVFLYLYPIEEFYKVFLLPDTYYEETKRENPFTVLNECIQKRYRENNYKIVYAIYPDKKIYGITPLPSDFIIYTDATFEQASSHHKDGNKKQQQDIQYPNERKLIEQLGDFDEIVIGGFHFSDCVKRVAEYCYQSGISTLVDLDLTDLFFNLYYQEDYFKIDEYDPKKYKDYMISNSRFINEEMALKFMIRQYNSPVYGLDFSKQSNRTR